jgi:hypothetical protein
MSEACSNYNPAKQEDVKQVIQLHHPLIVCLQGNKLSELNAALVNRCLGSAYASNFWYLPADGTRGGILLACRDIAYQLQHLHDLYYSNRLWHSISMVTHRCLWAAS